MKDYTTNSASGPLSGTLTFPGINIDKNFTIYYAQAIINGQSIAEKLNGAYGLTDTNGGRFFWMSNYNNGFWSSTNVVYPDGTTNRLNTALVTSCSIDSNTNGIPNCRDTNPIPVLTLTPTSLSLALAVTNLPARAVVSWNTRPGFSNYLYGAASPSLPAGSWQLVSNFVSGPDVSGRVTVTVPLQTNSPRYFRVGVVPP